MTQFSRAEFLSEMHKMNQRTNESLNESIIEYDYEDLDEGLALSIAGGIVLGVVGLTVLYNGAKVASALVGAGMVKAAEMAGAASAAKRAQDKVAKTKEYVENVLKPLAKKFENDTQLKKMYADLTPYMSGSSQKKDKNNKKRTKEMNAIAKYIKLKLTPEELSYFADLSKYLRTGAFENNEFYLDVSSLNEAAFPDWEVSFKAMNLSGVKLNPKNVYKVKARGTGEAIKKAAKLAGVKDGEWIATETNSLKKL